MNNDNQSDVQEDEEDDNHTPDYQETLLAYIRQMKAEGVVFTSNNDTPDDSGESKSQGHT